MPRNRVEPADDQASIVPPVALLSPHVEDWLEPWERDVIAARNDADVRLFLIEYEALRRWRRAVLEWGQPLGLEWFDALVRCGYRDRSSSGFLPWRDLREGIIAAGLTPFPVAR